MSCAAVTCDTQKVDLVKLRDLGALIMLAALWGGSFLFMRIAAPALGPVVLAEARVLIAGGALLLYAAAIHRSAQLRALAGFAEIGTQHLAVILNPANERGIERFARLIHHPNPLRIAEALDHELLSPIASV